MSSPKPEGGLQGIFIKPCFYRQLTNNAEILLLAFEKAVICEVGFQLSIISADFIVNLSTLPLKSRNIFRKSAFSLLQKLIVHKISRLAKEQRYQN